MGSVMMPIRSAPPPPKNGKWWVCMLVGGVNPVRVKLRQQLAPWNIELRHWVEAGRQVRSVPVDVDFVLYLHNFAGHAMQQQLASLNTERVPVLMVTHKWTMVAVALRDRGYQLTATHPELAAILRHRVEAETPAPVLEAVPSPPPVPSPPRVELLPLTERLAALAAQLFEECAASGYSVLVTPDDVVITEPEEGSR